MGDAMGDSMRDRDETDDLQAQARALGDPTRHAIFRHLAAAADPVRVADLAALVAVNHNAVRQHLAKLVAAGLVTERVAPPTGRGRPPLLYTVDPAVDARWGTVGPYERVAVLLAEVLRTGDAPIEVGRRDGARSVAGARAGDPVDVLTDQMRRHGFDPEPYRRGDRFELVLRNCPFASAALTDPETVCSLHLGIARGIGDALGTITVDDLDVADPRIANCRLSGRLAGRSPD